MLVTLVRVMLTVVWPLTVPNWAVIVGVPAATPFTTPVLVTVAIVSSEDCHVIPDLLVTSPVLLSLKVAVAAICWVEPTGMFTLDGPTVMLLTVGFTKNPLQLTAKARPRITANEPISFNFFADMFSGTPWAAGSGAGGAILWLNCSREKISFELHFRAMPLGSLLP